MRQNKLMTALAAIFLLGAMLAGCGNAAGGASGSSQTGGQAPSASVFSPDNAGGSAAVLENETSTGAAGEAPQPIYAGQIADGTYAIEVSSSSSMFKIVDCQLTVAGDEMRAVVTLSGTGYGMLYMGTGGEALADSEDKYIPFVEDAQGMYTYEVPVEALDMEIDIAAWSIRKETWYNRVCVFQSALIPAEAIDPD